MAAAERTRLEDELQAVQAELQALNQRKRELLTKQREIELKIEEVENRNAAARSAVDWENGDFEWNAEVGETLRSVFRLEDFRELQRSAVNLVLSGHDAIQGCSILRSSFNRPNLHYEVRPKSEKGEVVTQEIVQLLTNDFANQSGIIYCLVAKGVRGAECVLATRTNLYAMMAYATTFLCRRELIARHFGELYDPAWCDAACDVCVRGKERESVEFDITPYSAKIFVILEAKSKAADQGRLTGNKLSELLAKQCPDVTREFLEMIVAHLLLTGGLREEFHFTPYSVISYLVPGFNRGAQLSSSMTIDAALLDACWTTGGPSAAKKIRKK
ncbi:ATP-dependent DNA helicase [Aphelenchoides fujianensis]|nr:ATP-dependent DNA helicase [Aphelenchoides fujianensis]